MQSEQACCLVHFERPVIWVACASVLKHIAAGALSYALHSTFPCMRRELAMQLADQFRALGAGMSLSVSMHLSYSCLARACRWQSSRQPQPVYDHMMPVTHVPPVCSISQNILCVLAGSSGNRRPGHADAGKGPGAAAACGGSHPRPAAGALPCIHRDSAAMHETWRCMTWQCLTCLPGGLLLVSVPQTLSSESEEGPLCV